MKLHRDIFFFCCDLTLFAQLTANVSRALHSKLNVYFTGLQGEKLQVINCEFSEKYCE